MKETLRKIDPRRIGCVSLGAAFFLGVVAANGACEAHVAVGTPADGRLVLGTAIGDSLKTELAIQEAYELGKHGPSRLNVRPSLDVLGVAWRLSLVSSNPAEWGKILEIHGPDIR